MMIVQEFVHAEALQVPPELLPPLLLLELPPELLPPLEPPPLLDPVPGWHIPLKHVSFVPQAKHA